MKQKLLVVLVLCGFLQTVWAQQLTVSSIMRDQKKWLGTSPTNVQWSEDNKSIYFWWNPEKHPADSLYRYDIASGKTQKASLEEHKWIGDAGIYNKQRTQRVFTRNGDIYLEEKGIKKQLTHTIEAEHQVSYSTDEQQIFYIRGGNLYSYHLKEGTTRQLTDFRKGNKETTTKQNAQDEWLKKDQLSLFDVLKEKEANSKQGKQFNELLKEKRPLEIYTGKGQVANIKVCPNGRFITYAVIHSAENTQSTIVPNYVTASGYTENIPARVKVGGNQPTQEFWIYDIEQGKVNKLDVSQLEGIRDKPDYAKEYPKMDSTLGQKDRSVVVAGPFYSDGGSNAVVVIRSRDNKDRWIARLNWETQTIQLLDRQRDEAWIGGPGIGSPYGSDGGTLGWLSETLLYFQSEATGYSHLYTIDVVSGKKTSLTSGKYEVQEVKLSNDKKFFYLTTNEAHPGEKHFYKISIDGKQKVRLTEKEGAHEVFLSPSEQYLAIRYSNSNTPWELFVQPNKAGATTKQITKSTTEEFNAYPWRKAKVVTVPARDGASIYARVYEPVKSNGKAIIFVHGAGYLQNAHKWWSQYSREYMFHNLLVDKGYTVLDMDFRASAGYGRNWRTGIYRHMGGKDLTDNIDGAKWLIDTYGVNPSKIGIYGGSYGGFITLMAQFTSPGTFAAGAALRPVTDWAAYNHPYTANILNEPTTDSLAYRRSSPIYFAEGLKDRLLICHGMVDVNVHFQDVVRLSQRLIELGKENWELAVYPVEDHGFVEASSWTDEYRRILKMFDEM